MRIRTLRSRTIAVGVTAALGIGLPLGLREQHRARQAGP
ncbi:hypothetical protein RKD33_000749 [Streptomyces sp. SAI-129]